MIKKVTAKARDLRINQTESEIIIWDSLRAKKLGKKFVRQKPTMFEYLNLKREFIADFYCHEAKLVVEIDGKYHSNQKEYDELRTIILQQLGMRVIRFTNKQVKDDLGNVLSKLRKEIG